MTQFSPPSHDPQAPVWELSGWWRRVGAQIIDWIIIGVVAGIIGAIVGIATLEPGTGLLDSAGFVWAVILAQFVVSIAYYAVIMPRTNGQTVGKMALEIRVVREDGAAVSAGWSVLREVVVIDLLFGALGQFLFGLPALLDYLWPLWDTKNQALHDKIVKSRVVRATPVGHQQPVDSSPYTQQAYGQQPGQPQYGQRVIPPDPFAPQPAATTPGPPQPPPPPGPPPPPPPPGGTSTPYTPPPGFENPVPDDDESK
jgi:uncharacterized RDD family membrane protein YckC